MHSGNGEEKRQVQTGFDFGGTTDGRIKKELDQERQGESGNDAANGDHAESLHQLSGFPVGGTRRLSYTDVGHLPSAEGLVEAGLFEAGREMAVFGFFGIFLSLQLRDGRLEFIDGFSISGQFLQLGAEDL